MNAEDYSKNRHTTHIVDGNALLQALSGILSTFGEVVAHVFAPLPQSVCVHFFTDRNKDDSIKRIERQRGRSSEDNDCVPVLLRGSATTVPRHWKSFLTYNENKTSMTRFLLKEWESDEYATKLKNREVSFVCEERCTMLFGDSGESTTAIPLPDLY